MNSYYNGIKTFFWLITKQKGSWTAVTANEVMHSDFHVDDILNGMSKKEM